ncbi:MAG: hypothetical protein LAO20_17410 [Acidobacteriia bacterium]|nr:hypothetical protein [Terriglobia bacterium]
MMFHGVHGDFRWLEASSHTLPDVVRVCPDAFAGKNLVITLFDSGPLEPTPLQIEQGWRVLDSAVYVPAVENPATLPSGDCDEWYLFDSTPADLDFEVFIAYKWFTLGPASSSKTQAKTRWDLKRLQHIFWQQMATLRPESYLACGHRLIFVTRNADYFSRVLRGLSSEAKAQARGR